jgi:diguanylate cyclase (GGDEF)-like protein
MLQNQQGQSPSTAVLPGCPSIQVVHHMLAEALDNQTSSIEVAWKSDDQTKLFTLSVKSDPIGRDPTWQLYQSTGGSPQVLWQYPSCDTLIVLNRVMSSCGQSMSPVQLTAVGAAAVQASHAVTEVQKQADEFYYEPSSTQAQRKTIPLPAMSAAQTAMSKRNTVLNGELSFIQISALLQSIFLAKMTGRLQLDSGEGAAEIFFEDGKPTHATTPSSKGDESIFELIAWQDGKFFFQPQVITKKRTVSDGLDSLIIHGVQLLDKLTLLRNSGFKTDGVLRKANENISEVDLNTMLSLGDPALIEVQRRLYHAIDNVTPFNQIIKALGMERSRWIPALSHLFRCKLVTIGGESGTRKRILEAKTIDSAAVQAVMMTLRRADTGMFNYPAFLYFLEQEYFRGHRAGTPLSVIIFELRVKTGIKEVIREPLPANALSEAVLRIMHEKRHNDMLAHYESFDYALLCPDTKGEGAVVFAKRLVKSLTKEPLSNTVNAKNLSLSFGIACVPEDFLELGLILSAAETARTHSVETEDPVVIYRQME